MLPFGPFGWKLGDGRAHVKVQRPRCCFSARLLSPGKSPRWDGSHEDKLGAPKYLPPLPGDVLRTYQGPCHPCAMELQRKDPTKPTELTAEQHPHLVYRIPRLLSACCILHFAFSMGLGTLSALPDFWPQALGSWLLQTSFSQPGARARPCKLVSIRSPRRCQILLALTDIGWDGNGVWNMASSRRVPCTACIYGTIDAFDDGLKPRKLSKLSSCHSGPDHNRVSAFPITFYYGCLAMPGTRRVMSQEQAWPQSKLAPAWLPSAHYREVRSRHGRGTVEVRQTTASTQQSASLLLCTSWRAYEASSTPASPRQCTVRSTWRASERVVMNVIPESLRRPERCICCQLGTGSAPWRDAACRREPLVRPLRALSISPKPGSGQH